LKATSRASKSVEMLSAFVMVDSRLATSSRPVRDSPTAMPTYQGVTWARAGSPAAAAMASNRAQVRVFTCA
jgi:hypothetical protein